MKEKTRDLRFQLEKTLTCNHTDMGHLNTLSYACFKLTFSLTTSPVSFTCAFVFPLTGLLHSTRGSWRKVFKTLKLKIKKG